MKTTPGSLALLMRAITYPVTSDCSLMLPAASMPESETTQRGSLEGAITEALALARLLRMDLSVARPVVDNGVDLMVYEDGHCLTVQVKGSRGRMTEVQPGYTYLHYNFFANSGWKADVNLLYGERDSAWWVIPSRAIHERGIKRSLGIFPEGIHRPQRRSGWLEPYREAWDLIPAMLAHAATTQQAFELAS